ncbi:ATP-binding protein [Butyricimonas virosa]|uniref:ATP-binding protein n=1 Tax=Butyricimonas virosa TaxID=544645 RepID=UPI0034A3D1CF
MEIMNKNKQIRVEELKYKLLQQRITNTRFKLPMSFDDAKVYLLAAYQAEVERRHRVFERNEYFDEQLNLIANYLTGGSKKFGLMFCGLCGNGKTTWAKALQLLVSGLNLKNPINNLYYVFPLCNAKDLAMRSKGNYNDWRNVMRYQLMIVDDLGTEPREVMEFGNVYTPLIDLITTRYEEQLYTIFTTNLTPAQLEEKYGKRIVDRLNEMVEKVVFENESYRR